MRRFFLRDKLLTSCGNSYGRGSAGIAYFCPRCGEIWGRVELAWMDWMVSVNSCTECGRHGSEKWGHPPALCPGSFLFSLSWWDFLNGNSIPLQLDRADQTLLEYEVQVHAEWLSYKRK